MDRVEQQQGIPEQSADSDSSPDLVKREALEIFNITIKNPARTFEDCHYEVPTIWKVLDLKMMLSNKYQGFPKVTEQKLIFSGKILDNEQELSSVLKKEEEDHSFNLHLVVKSFMCSPKRTESEQEACVNTQAASAPQRNASGMEPSTGEATSSRVDNNSGNVQSTPLSGNTPTMMPIGASQQHMHPHPLPMYTPVFLNSIMAAAYDAALKVIISESSNGANPTVDVNSNPQTPFMYNTATPFANPYAFYVGLQHQQAMLAQQINQGSVSPPGFIPFTSPTAHPFQNAAPSSRPVPQQETGAPNQNQDAERNQANQNGRQQLPEARLREYFNIQLIIKLFFLGMLINQEPSIGRLMITGVILFTVYLQQMGMLSNQGPLMEKFYSWYASICPQQDATAENNNVPLVVKVMKEVQGFVIGLVVSLLPSFSVESLSQARTVQEHQHQD